MTTTIGNLFREARDERGLSRAALGRLSGVPAATIEAWERGSIKAPNLVQAAKLARALAIEPYRLVEAALDGEEGPGRYAELAARGPGATLAALRAARGLSVEDAANIMRASPDDIVAWEGGASMPSHATEMLVAVLGASFTEG